MLHKDAPSTAGASVSSPDSPVKTKRDSKQRSITLAHDAFKAAQIAPVLDTLSRGNKAAVWSNLPRLPSSRPGKGPALTSPKTTPKSRVHVIGAYYSPASLFLSVDSDATGNISGTKPATQYLSEKLVSLIQRQQFEQEIAQALELHEGPVVRRKYLISAAVRTQMLMEYYIDGPGSASLKMDDTIAPLSSAVIDRILRKATVKDLLLASGIQRRIIRACVDQVHSDYSKSVRRSIMHYISMSAGERRRLLLEDGLQGVRKKMADAGHPAAQLLDLQLCLKALGTIPTQFTLTDTEQEPAVVTLYPSQTTLIPLDGLNYSEKPFLLLSCPIWSDAWPFLVQPLTPHLLVNNGVSHLHPGNVAATSVKLCKMLGKVSWLNRELANNWYDICETGALFVSVPSSNTAAFGEFADVFDSLQRTVAAWETMEVRAFVDVQTTHVDRVRAAMMTSWHSKANAALDTFVQLVQQVMNTKSGSTVAEDAHLNLLAIATGNGPFAMPLSIREQLTSDAKLRMQMTRIIQDYAHESRMPSDSAPSRDISDTSTSPRAFQQVIATPAAVLGVLLSPVLSAEEWWGAWKQAHGVDDVSKAKPRPASASVISSSRPTSAHSRIATPSRPLSPWAPLPPNSRFRSTPSAAPGGALVPKPPTPTLVSRGERPMLATTKWRLEHDHHLKPIPGDAEQVSLQLAVEAMPNVLPLHVNACLHVCSTALLSMQVRDITLRSIAALFSMLIRYVPRRQRSIVRHLVKLYSERTGEALQAKRALLELRNKCIEESQKLTPLQKLALPSASTTQQEMNTHSARRNSIIAGEESSESRILTSENKFDTVALRNALGEHLTKYVEEALGQPLEIAANASDDIHVGESKLLADSVQPLFLARLEINQTFDVPMASIRGGSTATSIDPFETMSPLIFAEKMRAWRAHACGTSNQHGGITTSQYLHWKSQQVGNSRTRIRCAAADKTVPFLVSPTAEEVQRGLTDLVCSVIRSTEDIPTIAFSRSQLWKRANTATHAPTPSTTSNGPTPAASATGSNGPMFVPRAVCEDAVEKDSLAWMVSGSSTSTWMHKHQFLQAVSEGELPVQNALQAMHEIARQSVEDVVVVADVFEPFAYLLVEPQRLDIILADTQEHLESVGTAFDGLIAQLNTDGNNARGNVNPAPLLSIDMCSQLLNQYSLSLQALDQAVADITMEDLGHALSPSNNSTNNGVDSAARPTSVRRGSAILLERELNSSVYPLPLTISLDLFKLDCSGVITQLKQLAEACMARVVGYLDDCCLKAYKGLTTSFETVSHAIRERPQTPTDLIKADAILDRATKVVLPRLTDTLQVLQSDLLFLLRLHFPVGIRGKSETEDGPLEVDMKPFVPPTPHEHDDIVIQGLEEPRKLNLPFNLSHSDRIGGASIATLETAARAKMWERYMPNALATASSMLTECRTRMEQHAREQRAHVEGMLAQTSAGIDRLRNIADPSVAHHMLHSTSLKAVSAIIKPIIDELPPLVESLQVAKRILISVVQQEKTLDMVLDGEKHNKLIAYLESLSSDGVVTLPWGTRLQFPLQHEECAEVDVCVGALQPLVETWTLARDVITRVDRWMSGPVFSIDRDDVTAKVTEMKQLIARCIHYHENPSPTLTTFLRRCKGLDLPTIPTTDEEGDSNEHLKERSRVWGVPMALLQSDAHLEAIIRALETRLSSFTSRGYPLIRVLCNLNLSPAHWDRINAVVGGKIGPPTSRQRGLGKSNAAVSAGDSASVSKSDRHESATRRSSLASTARDVFSTIDEEDNNDDDDSVSVPVTEVTTSIGARRPAERGRRPSAATLATNVSVEAELDPAIANLAQMLLNVPPSTNIHGPGRGPSLAQLIESHNIDDRIADLLVISEEADQASIAAM